MATETRNFVEILNQYEAFVTDAVVPLITGNIVQKTDEEKADFSKMCRRMNEMTTAIRSAHDEWVKLELETNKDSKLETIRKMKGAEKEQGGFLSL